jgi:hypothetical protein
VFLYFGSLNSRRADDGVAGGFTGNDLDSNTNAGKHPREDIFLSEAIEISRGDWSKS